MSEKLRESLFQSADGGAFVAEARRGESWTPLRTDVEEKVRAGQTTIQELLRVTSMKADDVVPDDDEEGEAPPAEPPASPAA